MRFYERLPCCRAYRRMVDADADFRQIYAEAFQQWTERQLELGREQNTLTALEAVRAIERGY